MPLQISRVRGFELTHVTFIHLVLGGMLSHVVLKLLHTTPLFTTLSAFKRLFTVHSIVVQSQFGIIRKRLSTIIAHKWRTLHVDDFIQLIRRINIIGFSGA